MRRKVHGFFYAPTIYGGWRIGKPSGLPVLLPVDQPDTSSIALSLVASVDGLKSFRSAQ